MNEILKEVEKRITKGLMECEDIQFKLNGGIRFGELVLEVKVKARIKANVCPNYSDSRNDCEKCNFGNFYHLVEGRCQPRLNLRVELDYSNLKPYSGELKKSRRVGSRRKGEKGGGRSEKSKRELESADWV